jgi:peptidoglycan/LPS O-acetylase OafA/YrhL
MTVNKSKWILAGIWLVGAGLILLLMVLQSLMGYYGTRTEDAWSWYLPTVMPTLSLILGVLVADFRAEKAVAGSRRNSGPLLGLSVGISVFYLLLVSLTILMQPFLPQTSPLELMQRSNLWLGPVQGLAAATLAAFFRGG